MKKNFYKYGWFWLVIIILLIFATWTLPILIICIAGLIIYKNFYFKSKKFQDIKQNVNQYVEDCNELNNHIEELRNTYITMKKTDYGEAKYQNISRYKYKKRGIANAKYTPYIYDCSRSVCDNARKKPFKYICKYFNIKSNEDTLEEFEEVLNNFMSAEEGKFLLENKKNDLLKSISKDIPGVIKFLFPVTLEKALGFNEYKLNELYFPIFSFRYISAGGNSGTQFDIVMDIEMLGRFINYLLESIKFKKTVEGQRKLMTPKLRKYIIERDNHTCKYCGNSTKKEPNLLLEVDHIIPLAKGGTTVEENLQTLCWKCNRSKGSKILE